jgi:hypothetical protein
MPPPDHSWSNRFADAVIRHRGAFVLGVLAAGLVAAFGIPRLRTDSSPEQLVASHDGQRQLADELRRRFGDSDRVVFLLVRAEDVLAPAPLAHVHALSRHFREAPFVEAVRSVTVTPVPRAAEGAGRAAQPAASGAADLADLDDLDDLADLADLDDLADLEDEEPVPIEVHDALGTLARAEPERFPRGVLSVHDRLGALEAGPLVRGDTVEPGEVRAVRRALDDAPLLQGRLVSADRTVAAVALDLAPGGPRATERAVDAIEAWLAAHPPPVGVRVDVGGLPVLRTVLADGIERDRAVLLPLTLLVCALLLFASFRWTGGVVLPLVTVGVAAVVVVGGMGATGVPMNVLNNVVPALLIVIGLSDGIHIVNRYREELRALGDRAAAARRTVKGMAVACFSTSITTSVGLASLAVSRTEMLRTFGLLASVGILLAYVVTILFLPPALTWFRVPPRVLPQGPGRLERGIEALTAALMRRPWAVLAAALAVLAVGVVGASRIEVDTALEDQLDEGDPALATLRLMDTKLAGTRPLEILLRSEREGRLLEPDVLAVLDETARWLEGHSAVLATMSAADPLHELWRHVTGDPSVRRARFRSGAQVEALAVLLAQSPDDPLRAWARGDGRIGRMQVMLADVGARRSAALIEALRARLEARLPADVTIGMTGEGYVGSFAVESIVSDLSWSLGLAVVVIFGTLTLLFRSVRLGLLSVPPNVIPLVLTAAWMALRGISLNVATVIIFSISLGLAVDGTIHVLVRFREERRRGRDPEAALLCAARGSGRAIVVSTLTLAAGFGVLAFSELVPVRRMGELIAVTVVGCLLADLIVLPPLLKLFGAPRGAPRRRRAPGGEKEREATA